MLLCVTLQYYKFALHIGQNKTKQFYSGSVLFEEGNLCMLFAT